jgi:hypothetical protein
LAEQVIASATPIAEVNFLQATERRAPQVWVEKSILGKRMSYLVTGATGSVGRNIASQLRSIGADVRIVSRRPEQTGLPSGVDVVEGDFAKGEFLDSLFDGITKVFVFPAEGGVDAFVDMLLSSATKPEGGVPCNF